MSDSKQGLCIALAAVFMALPILAVAARIWARAIVIRNVGELKSSLHADDYFIFAALLIAEGMGIAMIFMAVDGNLGQYLTYNANPEVPDQVDALVVFLKAEYVLSVIEKWSIWASKLSLLALYRRIFSTPVFKRVVLVVGTFITLWTLVMTLLFVLQCLPIAAVWDFELAFSAKCLDKLALWRSYAVIDVFTDALVLCLPIPAILSLQMSASRKLAVSAMFLLGLVVTAAAITRTVYFFITGEDSFAQITYTAVPVVYWSFIETSLAVVGACLPTMLPLFGAHGFRSLPSKIRSITSLLATKRSASGSGSDISVTEHKTEVYVSKSVSVERV